MNWNWSDAWLLMSVMSVDKKGTDLRGIISTGDYINHCIFSFNELKSGIEKLISVGYVRVEKNRFFTTPAFNRDYKKLKASKVMLKAIDQLYEHLKTKSINKEEVEQISAEIISESIVKNAYEEYMKTF